MIYVTGDTHGFQSKWEKEIEPILEAGDSILVAGDFGIGFFKACCRTEEEFFDEISVKPYTVLFLDGNHEDFDRLGRYPIEEWNGGRVHKIRENIIHLMRGEVYTIEGKTIFTFGGGYSLDRLMRTEHLNWWKEEMPSKEEYANAEQNLAKAGYHVDYILTHTAPSETIYYLSTMSGLGIKNSVPEEQPLTFFLDVIRSKVKYSHWYFGHLHVDVELWRSQTAVFSCIRELESGKIVKEWMPYEG